MGVGAVTDVAVREALHALCYAKPLFQSPLLYLDVVHLCLQEEGLADTAQARSYVLARLLSDVVRQQLARRRGAPVPRASHGPAPDEAVRLLEEDFSAASPEREAWSMLHFRYLAGVDKPGTTAAGATGVPRRTLQRRLRFGCRALTECLRELETAAGRELASVELPLLDRILVAERSAPEPETETLDRLLAAARSERGIVTVSPDQLRRAARRAVVGPVGYRLGRIAQWSQPRYRLDDRFVALSMLVDLGTEAEGGRWQARAQRFSDLRAVLETVREPAIVLLGPPGSGKSTLLRRLELDLSIEALRAEGRGGVPLTFLVSLNTFRRRRPGAEPPAPRQWLAERWAARFPNMPSFDQCLAEGDMILLLDGLNEMPHRGPEDYRERTALWKQFLQETIAAAGARVVAACRSLDYSAPLSSPAMPVPQVRLEPLTDDQVTRFLQRYAPGLETTLWGQLRGTQLLEAVRWPFFLRLLTEQAAETGSVAGGLAELFTTFTHRALMRELERDNPLFSPGALIDGHDYERLIARRERRTTHDLPARGLLFGKLADLAYWMQSSAFSGEASQVRVGYAAALTALQCAEAESVVRAGEELGVLEEDRLADELHYAHQLLQEYFAARRLARRPQPELAAVEWRADRASPSVGELIDGLALTEPLPTLPRTGWEETTGMAVAMSSDPTAHVVRLADANLALAGRIAARLEVGGRLDGEALDGLRWRLTRRGRDPDADLRDRIACGDAVGALGDPRFERRAGPFGEYLWPPMASIAGGSYPIGDDDPITWKDPPSGESRVECGHTPRHEVAVASFCIGRYAVTNAEWALFMAAGGYGDDRWWDTADAARWRRGELVDVGAKVNNRAWRRRFVGEPILLERMADEGAFADPAAVERWRSWMALDDDAFERALERHWQPKRRTAPLYWREERYNRPTQPVVGVCWYEARAYCSWLSAQTGRHVRLPSEVEWESAARGPEARLYPWGDRFHPLRANTVETHVRTTTPVGVFPPGDTPLGLSDMSGNVLEWTTSLWGEYSGEESEAAYGYPYDATDGREDVEAPPSVARVARGGSWSSFHPLARAASRNSGLPGSTYFGRGFRLAADVT